MKDKLFFEISHNINFAPSLKSALAVADPILPPAPVINIVLIVLKNIFKIIIN